MKHKCKYYRPFLKQKHKADYFFKVRSKKWGHSGQKKWGQKKSGHQMATPPINGYVPCEGSTTVSNSNQRFIRLYPDYFHGSIHSKAFKKGVPLEDNEGTIYLLRM